MRPTPDYFANIKTTKRSWVAEAACRGMGSNIFFPERQESPQAAKGVCSSCPVRIECAEEGMGERFGIWGGLTARERRGLRRASRRVA